LKLSPVWFLTLMASGASRYELDDEEKAAMRVQR
jgi:hypothetical protein